MYVGIIHNNPLEYVANKAGLVANPLIKTQIAYTMAKSIMAAVEVGLFESLQQQPANSQTVASLCQTNLKATTMLLNAMVSCEYLNYNKNDETYSLTDSAKKWLIKSSPHSICDKLIFQNYEWEYLNQLVPYIRSDQPIELHHHSDTTQWHSYQKAMSDIGKLALNEVNSRIPIPKHATKMLDIGGSGGTYSAAFVKSRPQLQSLILDLPQAVVHAQSIVESHIQSLQLSENKLSIQAGNALQDDLGQDQYDFIFLGNVAHHLSAEQNQLLTFKVQRALKENGVFCILEPARTQATSKKSQFGSLLDLYFGLTSQSGTWAVAEMQNWMKMANLKIGSVISLRTAPGVVLIYGTKL